MKQKDNENNIKTLNNKIIGLSNIRKNIIINVNNIAKIEMKKYFIIINLKFLIFFNIIKNKYY